MTQARRFGIAGGAAWLASTAASAWACPMCKMALETDDPQPRAYMISILFMLFMITTVTGAVGVLLFWINRAEKRALAAAGYSHVLHNAVNAPRPQSDPA